MTLPDRDTAVEEFKTLLVDLEEAGLDVEVRPGYEQTLLIFVKAPRELLGNTVYKSRYFPSTPPFTSPLIDPRVKDWLYGITPNHPGGDKNTVVDGAYEAEDILSLYHLINWPKTLGGAGITPGLGKWENVKAIFPLHNPRVNQALLRHLSKRIFLTPEDIDSIRDILGSKVSATVAYYQHLLTT